MLVAFIIAALAMGVLFSVAASDLGSVAVAGRYEEAVSRARSHLAAVGVDGVLSPGERQGGDGGGYHYLVRIAQIAATAASAGAPRPALYGVMVAISWREGEHVRIVRLLSQRVALAPASPP